MFKYILINSSLRKRVHDISLGPTLGARIYGIIWGRGGRESKQTWWKVGNISAGLKQKKAQNSKTEGGIERKKQEDLKSGKPKMWNHTKVKQLTGTSPNYTIYKELFKNVLNL